MQGFTSVTQLVPHAAPAELTIRRINPSPFRSPPPSAGRRQPAAEEGSRHTAQEEDMPHLVEGSRLEEGSRWVEGSRLEEGSHLEQGNHLEAHRPLGIQLRQAFVEFVSFHRSERRAALGAPGWTATC